MDNLDDNTREYFEANTLRLEVSHRGGGIEIDCEDLLGYPLRMTAYQNYLGGGMTGAIGGSIEGRLRDRSKAEQDYALKLNELLKQYFYELSNPEVAEYDDWAASESYEAQQRRAESGY